MTGIDLLQRRLTSDHVETLVCPTAAATGLLKRVDSDLGKYKRRKTGHVSDVEDFVLPTLCRSDYFTVPSIAEMNAREEADAGYCSRVPNFVVGRVGYGCIRFLGSTDVRWLELDRIVSFDRNTVAVYGDGMESPPVGDGLNKAAEVSLFLKFGSPGLMVTASDRVVTALRKSADRQGAKFISFDSMNGEWKFLVQHFSKFGLDDEEEEDVVMGDALARQPATEVEEPLMDSPEPMLSHSHPAFLGLDPGRMQELRNLMFPVEEEDEGSEGLRFLPDGRYRGKEHISVHSPNPGTRSSIDRRLHGTPQKMLKPSPPSARKPPQALIEYNVNNSNSSPSKTVAMTGQNKGLTPRLRKAGGFKFEPSCETPVTGSYSKNIVDAALFMGRSFRVGWGPNGILVHCGAPVGSQGSGLSSVLTMEKVAVDKAARDERNRVKEELFDLSFSSPLELHKDLNREVVEIDVNGFKIELHKVIVSRLKLSQICQAYIAIIHKQLEVVGLSGSSRVLLIHQVTIWELIKVLFSERKGSRPLIDDGTDADAEEVMMLDKDDVPDTDLEASPFIRRAEFSHWLQESVCHRVQHEVSCLSDSSDLEQILLLLTGRQLDSAVELAASRGDVRMSILLSQAGGSMVNRSDMAHQLDLWRVNGLDFKYIENDRQKLYELLAGNIQGALKDSSLDWKRFLGMVMWYQLPPDTSLPVIFNTYQQLLVEGKAPHPVPVYIDEGPLEDAVDWRAGDRYDIAYYLMLLHGNEDKPFDLLKTLFSAFSSTHDPLDYNMIWHQRSILEAIGTFSSDDLQVLDMSFITQLLSVGQCHWAIYVALHMMYHDGVPHVQTNLIREILFQYCETWSTDELQRRFIEGLGIPSAWMHEALAIYFQYYGDLPEALEHFLECSNWHKAHSIFVTSVAHSLFLSSKRTEIWRITSSMEKHKSEIADWDLGAGIYIDFYTIKDSLLEENSMGEPETLEMKTETCKRFFSHLNESVLVWGSKLPLDARATYSKMAEEISSLLAFTPGGKSTLTAQITCFDTVLSAPIPADVRSGHLQDALSVFTYMLSSSAS